jgi:Zn-finger nucleic acid-binding protein
MRPHGDTLVCDYCKNVVTAEKNDDGITLLGEARDQACPLCNLPLQQATLAKVPLLYCSKCQGMLASMEIFADLIDAARARHPGTIAEPPIDPADLNRHIGCPKCHRPMDTHTYCGPGNVVMDTCENCQLNWLDRGELARIAQAPNDAPNDRADDCASGFADDFDSRFMKSPYNSPF